MSEREQMEYDVVIVGGGPAGLATAIHLKKLCQANNQDYSICVLEKAPEIGAHILSGAIMDPKALTELIPDWKEQGAPMNAEVKEDRFLFLNESSSKKTPDWLLPSCFQNHGNYIVRLGELTRWLGEQAEALEIDVFPGFAASEIVYDKNGAVKGVVAGVMGLNRDGSESADYQPGMELLAKYTVFAEGARGHLGRELINKFKLAEGKDPQSYGIGIKELWEIDPQKSQPGLAIHTAGWPLDTDTYGGSFLYHLNDNLVAIGFIVGLDYKNPYLSPYQEFQRFKTHPDIRIYLENGKRLAYGARAIAAGGLLSLPKTVFPGGALVGCDAGYLNASRIKGSHAAIKSGMLCADAIFNALKADRAQDELTEYPQAFEKSWLYDELYKARNFKNWFKKGRKIAILMTGLEQKILNGKFPWTIHHSKADHECLLPAAQCQKIDYPKPDGKITFDRLTSVSFSNTNHREDEPCHLKLKDPTVPVRINLEEYAGPEQRYCPAGVYEFIQNEEGKEQLQINSQNCVHCKTCDIKDPTQNIVWVTPEGGEGPIYSGM
ncbi:electron transfer flavoprotein-ubiquinone oxidoreductase [Brackiella oedipodis]|uniref:electron transfer flavoprotein-ubiquinone oxidoreductase n=1 Tax=Brackiella oedipodis TaxID=124225 RepID=UPI00048FD79C|nr:electron transfer flavoprotein-ubiquinone oxidoreductase [Brackiella oedipodis]